jgi:hypothetical protein
MTIIATPGSTTANSYLTDADFLAYGEGSLASSRLASSTPATRERALRTATRMIDRLSFGGEATEYEQALSWPRELLPDPDRPSYFIPAAVIPRRVREACAELALALLAEGESSPDGGVTDADRYVRAKVDVLEVEYRQGVATATDPVGVLRRYPAVLALLAPFIVGGGAMEVARA